MVNSSNFKRALDMTEYVACNVIFWNEHFIFIPYFCLSDEADIFHICEEWLCNDKVISFPGDPLSFYIVSTASWLSFEPSSMFTADSEVEQ